jgi:hypothetical protein
MLFVLFSLLSVRSWGTYVIQDLPDAFDVIPNLSELTNIWCQ